MDANLCDVDVDVDGARWVLVGFEVLEGCVGGGGRKAHHTAKQSVLQPAQVGHTVCKVARTCGRTKDADTHTTRIAFTHLNLERWVLRIY